MKIAFVSNTLPPSGSGQAVVIHRMLGGLDPASYALISSELHEPQAAGAEDARRLPGAYHYLPPPAAVRRGHRFGLYFLREGFNIMSAAVQHARRIARVVRDEGCGAVVACTGDLTHLPAAYLASRRAGVPFYAYIFDHFSYREAWSPVREFWARRLESVLMRGARRVIVPNETLGEDLRARFQIEPAVIHNSFDLSPYETDADAPSSARDGQVKIVYTGDVYEAHYDAFRNLMAALASLNRPAVKLHIYTGKTPEELAAAGISGAVVRHPYLAPAEIPRVQMEADVLFLPLAFESPFPALVRTSATTKLGEYLAARRPVLVHAPADSFPSWYYRRHDCGVVVDERDPAALAAGLSRLLDDAGLRRRLAANAWERAREDFDIEKSRAAFARLVGLDADGKGTRAERGGPEERGRAARAVH